MSISDYSLNWDSFKTNICDGFTKLQQQEEFVDMTLAADGHYVKVHRSLIALASPYLKEIIQSIPCQHPVVFLNNIGYDQLCYALEYIYTGEVQIPTDKVKEFLKIATSLHIKGIQDTLSCEINTHETSETTTQPTPPVTQENQTSILTTKLIVPRKARPRGRPYKGGPRADRVARKSDLVTEKDLSNGNPEINEEQERNESGLQGQNSNPGVSEFLTINRAQYEATQKDDSVSLSDFFITDDKDKEPQQENNMQSFITHPFPTSTKGKGIDSNAISIESVQPISLDEMSTDFFSKDLTSESSASTKQLFPGKIIDYGNEKGKNMFQIEVLSQEELVNGIRTKTDIYNDHINTEAFDDIEMEMQEETPRENVEPCPTLENFEDIIDQQQNPKTSQPTAQYNITLTGGECVSVQKVNTCETAAISTAVEAQTNNLKLTDADIKGSCCPQYTVSNQGSLQLIMNRFIYYLHNKSKKDSSRRRWRCVDYRRKGCKAVIDTDRESIVNRAGLHVHPFHDKQILNKSLQNKVFSTIAATKDDAQKTKNGSQSVVHSDESEEDES